MDHSRVHVQEVGGRECRSSTDGGSDVDDDSDAQRESEPYPGRTHTFALAPGQEETKVDCGLYRLGGIAGQMWFDYDRYTPEEWPGYGDGIRTEGEEGWPAELTRPSVLLLDGSGAVIRGTTITPVYGTYGFPYLDPGTYYVAFGLPSDPRGYYESFEFTCQDQGIDDTMDSDPNPLTGRVGPFVIDEAREMFGYVDAGVGGVIPSSPALMGAPDLRGGGRGDSVAGPDAPPPAAIRGRVWFDLDRDGVREPGEGAVGGLWVVLYDFAGRRVAATRTAADGTYRFDGLAAGAYEVRFTRAGGRYDFTRQDQGGDDTRDSDAGSDGRAIVSPLPGQEWGDLDAGLVPHGAPAP